MIESQQESSGGNLEETLRVLEGKIAAAAAYIRKLKDENSRLREENLRLAETTRSLEERMEEHRRQAAEAETWKLQVQELTELKKKIAGKIENLLSQIEEIPLENL